MTKPDRPDLPPQPSVRWPRLKNVARKPKQSRPCRKNLAGAMGPEPVRYGDWEKKGLAVDF